MTSLRHRHIAALVLAFIGNSPARAADPLPAMRAAPERTSVSGLSSGGFMAVQYGVAFSSSVVKVYVFSGRKDTKVSPAVVMATRDLFADAGVTRPRQAYVSKMLVGHAFIVPGFGNACGAISAKRLAPWQSLFQQNQFIGLTK